MSWQLIFWIIWVNFALCFFLNEFQLKFDSILRGIRDEPAVRVSAVGELIFIGAAGSVSSLVSLSLAWGLFQLDKSGFLDFLDQELIIPLP